MDQPLKAIIDHGVESRMSLALGRDGFSYSVSGTTSAAVPCPKSKLGDTTAHAPIRSSARVWEDSFPKPRERPQKVLSLTMPECTAVCLVSRGSVLRWRAPDP